MQLANATRKRINMLLKEKSMTKFALCKAGGIAPPVLSDFMNGYTKILRLDTVLHICEGFGISLQEFFNDPLFYDVISE